MTSIHKSARLIANDIIKETRQTHKNDTSFDTLYMMNDLDMCIESECQNFVKKIQDEKRELIMGVNSNNTYHDIID